jgi:hypothetical protein|tara:strand:+ start:3251 stop:3826 length:576 start_codon:yes stop_codon:yes gene_type:complete
MDEEVIYVDENNNPVNTVEPSPSSFNYPPTTGIKSDKADILDKIRPDKIVEIIRHKLMGEQLENNKWEKLPALKKRAISDVGAWDIANLMLGVSSQNVSLSKLTDTEIRGRALGIARATQKLCLKNWKEYEIKGTDQLEFIHQIVFSNTFITLKQPEGGGIRDLIKGTTQESRMFSSQEAPNKRGFFNMRR